jgi:ABC-type nitrate/sulfonate/bicarbonate transport system permease component
MSSKQTDPTSVLSPPAPVGRRVAGASGSALRNAWAKVAPFLYASATIVIIWELVVVITKPDVAILPSPLQSAETFGHLLINGELARDVYASLRRVILAWLAAAVLGIPLGLVMGYSRRFEKIADPFIELFRPISPLAWIPLAILWFGIGEIGKVFVVLVGTFFPIVLSTVAGVKSIDPTLISAARVYGCTSGTSLFRKVILPASLPSIVVGLRISFGTGWAAIIAAELVAAQSGLGYLIANGMEILRADEVLVGMAVIGVLGVLFDSVFRYAHRRLVWTE